MQTCALDPHILLSLKVIICADLMFNNQIPMTDAELTIKEFRVNTHREETKLAHAKLLPIMNNAIDISNELVKLHSFTMNKMKFLMTISYNLYHRISAKYPEIFIQYY